MCFRMLALCSALLSCLRRVKNLRKNASSRFAILPPAGQRSQQKHVPGTNTSIYGIYRVYILYIIYIYIYRYGTSGVIHVWYIRRDSCMVHQVWFMYGTCMVHESRNPGISWNWCSLLKLLSSVETVVICWKSCSLLKVLYSDICLFIHPQKSWLFPE